MIYALLSVVAILLILLIAFFPTRLLYVKNETYSFLSKNTVTALKGFSILLIMLGHIGNLFDIRYLNPLGSWGVGIFLFLSGFGLQKSFESKGLKKFWIKRLLTAYLPYFVFEIFGYIFLYKDLSFSSIALDIFLIKPIHPFGWYMQCIFICYILFYLFSLLLKEKSILKIVCIFLCSAIIFMFLKSLFREQLWMFSIGILIAAFSKDIALLSKKSIAGVIAFIVGVIFLAIKQFDFIRDTHYLVDFITSFEVLGLSIGSIFLINELFNKFSVFEIPFYGIGLISFELYLIHHWAVLPITNLTVFHFWFFSVTLALIYYLVKKAMYSLPKYILKRKKEYE